MDVVFTEKSNSSNCLIDIWRQTANVYPSVFELTLFVWMHVVLSAVEESPEFMKCSNEIPDIIAPSGFSLMIFNMKIQN